MPGPIAFGVFKTLDEQRRKRAAGDRWTPGQGWFVFVLSTVVLSLSAMLLIHGHLPAGEPVSIRLFWASLYLAATTGWQPLAAAWVARRVRTAGHEPDRGTRWPRMREIGIAMVVPIGLASVAMIVARIAGEEWPQTELVGGPGGSVLAVVAACLVLCLQAFGQESGWRGAPMSYAIERWGVRAGLVVHGIAWGCGYAPLFVLSSATPADALAPAAGFVLTCMLLGIILGWLRLRSGSILPPAIANAVLAIVAGLSVLLRDGSIGIRDAVFRWPGWPVLAVFVIVLSFARRGDFRGQSTAE